MGGDRNVLYAREGEPIFRSSRVLVDLPEEERDRHTVGELFAALRGDAVVVAHVGRRYADLTAGHDGRLERAVRLAEDAERFAEDPALFPAAPSRGRRTVWDGTAELRGNRFTRAAAVNFLNANLPLRQEGGSRLAWSSVAIGELASPPGRHRR